MKRIISTALAAAMVMGVMSGCGEKKESEIYEIKYYAYNNIQNDDPKVLEEVNKYVEEKIGARVNWITIPPNEYNEKMKMLFASNEEFDVCFQSTATDFYTNVRNGVFMPLDELLQKEGKEIYEMTPKENIEAATVDGKIYALPTIKDTAEEWVISCKKYLLDKYNIDTSNIHSLEDFTPIFQTIKDNEPNIYPVLMRGNNTFFRFLPFEEITGCSVGAFRTDSFDKVVNQYDTDEARAFFKLMREWYQKGFMRSDAATATNDSDIRAAGNFFAAYGGWLPNSDYVSEDTPEKDIMVNVHGLNEPHLRTANVFGSGLAISSNSKNPEKTMEFINLLNTDKYLRNLVAYGIEGVHYKAVGDNQWDLPDGVTQQTDTGYAPMVWPQGNRFILRTRAGVEPENMWDLFKEFNETATVYPTLGFVFNPDSVMNEVAAVENVYQEYAPSLMVGAVDPDEYLPKFLEKLKSAGLDKIIDEMQKQYDEWKASK